MKRKLIFGILVCFTFLIVISCQNQDGEEEQVRWSEGEEYEIGKC